MTTQSTQQSKLTGAAGRASVCAWSTGGMRSFSYLGSKETVITPAHSSGLFSRTAARNPEDLQRADL